jgi:hypothetical protein
LSGTAPHSTRSDQTIYSPPSTATLHPPFAKLKLFDADDDWKLLSQYLPASSSGVVWL